MNIRQIVIEAELPDDAQSMFRLSIDANLIAKGVTAAQAYYLIGEVLGGVGVRQPETAMFGIDDNDPIDAKRSHNVDVERTLPAGFRI
jgi:hypothetical protein